MKLNMYAIYDTVAEVFNKPFVEHNDSSAERLFRNAMLEAKQNNKDDFVLYKVGTWNDAPGEVTGLVPMKVISGLDIKKEAA